MSTLLLATRNPGKKREMLLLLQDAPSFLEICSLADLNIAGDVDENGATYAENARLKADFFSRLTGLDTLADDSGLEVLALGNRPGVFSARYAGAGASDDQRIGKLLEEMKGIGDRRARFVSAVCLSRAGQPVGSFTGLVRGQILHEKSGLQGFGYDPLFYYPPLKRTFAELTLDEKNRVSHRARAMRQLSRFITRGGLSPAAGPRS